MTIRGGFERIFLADPSARVYARRGVFDTYLSASGGMHEIGMPKNVAAYRDRFITADGAEEILPEIFLVPHSTEELYKIGKRSGLYKMWGSKLTYDDFAHEMSLAANTEDGLVIFNSCSHAGAANIIREVKEVCGQKRVRAYVGGLHMKGTKDGKEICVFSDAEIDDLCAVLEREEIGEIYTGHCTGAAGFEKLRARLGSRVHRLSTGLRFEI